MRHAGRSEPKVFEAYNEALVQLSDEGLKEMYLNFMLIYMGEYTEEVLEPGDIIATGTPEGVGAGMSPQEWLWPGDVVEAGVDGVGVIRHPVVAI